MTTEQLMQPRIKITAPWPYMPKKRFVGEVIQVTKEGLVWWEKYSSNIKVLHWWEDRKPVDMPGYVKWIKKWDTVPVRECGDVMLVNKWISNRNFVSEGEGWKLTGVWFEPATEQDFENYKKSKNEKQEDNN